MVAWFDSGNRNINLIDTLVARRHERSINLHDITDGAEVSIQDNESILDSGSVRVIAGRGIEALHAGDRVGSC